jgi:uncharacterized membrane-anchored protein YitT (DUF2179 family)
VTGRDAITITIGLGLLATGIVLRSVEVALAAAGVAGTSAITGAKEEHHDE